MPLEKEFVQTVAKICKERDILVAVDEVQTGIGRTGSLFCYQQYGIQPNIVSMAKGLGGGVVIGGFLADQKCSEVLTPGTHGSTFGGNPLSARAAQTVLSIVNRSEFLKEVKEKGDYLMDGLKNIASSKIKEVRGMGLMVGVIVDPEQRTQYVHALRHRGVLVLTAGKDAIRLLPPLIITKEQIDKAVSEFQEVFE